MKPSEIRDRSTEDLQKLLTELAEQLFKARIGKATQRLRNTAKMSAARRDIARIRTIIRERQLGVAGE